jgi:hypothetical protein
MITSSLLPRKEFDLKYENTTTLARVSTVGVYLLFLLSMLALCFHDKCDAGTNVRHSYVPPQCHGDMIYLEAIEDSLLAPFAFLAFCSFSLTGCPVLRGWLWCEA